MKAFPAIGIGIGALLLICFGFILLGYYFEQTRSHFDNYAEMKAAGMIDRGWLPDYLPKSSVDISESHNIDTNFVSAEFRYTLGDTKTVESACRLASRTSAGATYICSDGSEGGTVVLGSDGRGRYVSPSPGV